MRAKRRILIALAVVALAGLTALAVSAQEPAPEATQQGTEKAAPAKHHKAMPSAEIKAVQEALNQHGFNLKADGVMGRATKKALKKFQKDNGLKVTGKIDEPTKEKLGIGAKPAAEESEMMPEQQPSEEEMNTPSSEETEEPAEPQEEEPGSDDQ